MAGNKIEEALTFLQTDIATAKQQWELPRKQFESLLQRNGVSINDLLTKFDPQEDEQAWADMYNNATGEDVKKKLRLYRRRLAFLKASCKEFHEEYDPEVTDVDFIRLLEVPFTDSRFVIDSAIGTMKEK